MKQRHAICDKRCDEPTMTCRKQGRGGCCFPRLLWFGLLLAWIIWLVRSLLRIRRLRLRDLECPPSSNIPPWAVRKPDPMIYSQTFLQTHGLAVTWDNPDIHVELASNPGTPVDSHALSPATDYVVVARVWNGNANAPIVDLPVKLSYLEFGINTVRHDVAIRTVDLAVKGAPGCPAFARIPWKTPPLPGHYCLQVELLWDDDDEPGNNMGQHNTDVKPLNSPHAAFTFPIRNELDRARTFRYVLDSYRIPALEPCNDDSRGGELERRQAALSRHDPAAWPVPAGWRVIVQPERAALAAFETIDVTIDITAPDGFRGRQVINVSAYEETLLVGGVSLYVEGRD
jgi:hypothetical protein